MADYEFPLQAIQVGAQLGQQRFQRDLQSRQLAGQEAERALRGQQIQQDIRMNTLKIDEESNKIALQAKHQAMLELSTKGFDQAVANGEDPAEAALKHFAGPALQTGSNLDDVIRAATAMKAGKLKAQSDAAVAQQRALDTASKIKLRDAQGKLAEAKTLDVGKGSAGVPPQVVKLQGFIDTAAGEADAAEAAGDADLAAKKRALASVYTQAQQHLAGVKEEPSQSEFTKLMFPKLLKTYENSIAGMADAPEVLQKKALRATENLYQQVYGGKGKAAETAPPTTSAKSFRYDPTTRKLVPK